MKNKHRFQTVDAVIISVAHLLHDVYSSFLSPILPLLIEKLGISYSAAGFLSVAQRLPSLLNPVVGLMADKVSVRYFLIVAPTITAISMSLLGVAPNFYVLVVLLVIMGVGFFLMAPTPVLLASVNEIKSDHPAFVNSVYMMITFGISSVAAMLVGISSDIIGFRLTYEIAAVLSIGAVPAIIRMKKGTQEARAGRAG